MSTFVFKQVGDLTLIEIDGVELQSFVGPVNIEVNPHEPIVVTLIVIPTEGWEIAFADANIEVDTSQLRAEVTQEYHLTEDNEEEELRDA